MSERRYLLTRCLRLEAEIVRLRGKMAESYQRGQRYATPEDRARMCELRTQGKSVRTIATQTGWSVSMVYLVTKNVVNGHEQSASEALAAQE